MYIYHGYGKGMEDKNTGKGGRVKEKIYFRDIENGWKGKVREKKKGEKIAEGYIV